MKNYVGKLVIDEVSKEKWAMQSYFLARLFYQKSPTIYPLITSSRWQFCRQLKYR